MMTHGTFPVTTCRFLLIVKCKQSPTLSQDFNFILYLLKIRPQEKNTVDFFQSISKIVKTCSSLVSFNFHRFRGHWCQSTQLLRLKFNYGLVCFRMFSTRQPESHIYAIYPSTYHLWIFNYISCAKPCQPNRQ